MIPITPRAIMIQPMVKYHHRTTGDDANSVRGGGISFISGGGMVFRIIRQWTYVMIDEFILCHKIVRTR